MLPHPLRRERKGRTCQGTWACQLNITIKHLVIYVATLLIVCLLFICSKVSCDFQLKLPTTQFSNCSLGLYVNVLRHKGTNIIRLYDNSFSSIWQAAVSLCVLYKFNESTQSRQRFLIAYGRVIYMYTSSEKLKFLIKTACELESRES